MHSNSDELTCKYCYQQFKFQRNLDNHVCDNMRKEQIVQTVTGRAAHDLYNEWLRVQGRPPIDQVTFTRTKLFTTFIKFVIFARQCNYPSIHLFVEWAHRRGYLPVVWQRNRLYVEFLEYVDNHNFRKQLFYSVRAMERLCEDAGCEIEQFYDEVDPIEIVRALQLRKIFPIMLIATKGFGQFLSSLPPINKAQVESIANATRLGEVIQKQPAVWEEAKQLAEAMGL